MWWFGRFGSENFRFSILTFIPIFNVCSGYNHNNIFLSIINLQHLFMQINILNRESRLSTKVIIDLTSSILTAIGINNYIFWILISQNNINNFHFH